MRYRVDVDDLRLYHVLLEVKRLYEEFSCNKSWGTVNLRFEDGKFKHVSYDVSVRVCVYNIEI